MAITYQIPEFQPPNHDELIAQALDYAQTMNKSKGRELLDLKAQAAERVANNLIKAAEKPKITVTRADIEEIQAKRSERARKMDAARVNKKVRPLTDAGPWMNHPGRYDLAGVDTPKGAGSHTGLLQINRSGGTIIKRGKAKGRARKSGRVLGMKVIGGGRRRR